MGHVGWLTLEERIQDLMQKDPKMCPQLSETGFSASTSSAYCSIHMLQFSLSAERWSSGISGSASRNLLIDGSIDGGLESKSSAVEAASIVQVIST